MTMNFDFSAYVERRKTGIAGVRGEGYAFEGDLKVLRAMRRMPAVEIAVAQTVKLTKSLLSTNLLGTAVKVGPRQFPRIQRIVEECATTLGIPTPQVYIVPRIDSVNAMTFGTDEDAVIIVHAATFEHLNDDELKFVIGHECGHIQNNHVVYLTTLYRLQQIMQAAGGVILAPLLLPVTIALQSWSRSAEITCDRAGLLCCKDAKAATNSFAKLAIGSRRLFDEMDMDVYLEQLGEGRDGMGRMGELQMSHPYLTKRIESLRLFNASALYRGAVGLDGGLTRDELEARTTELIKVL
jgi:Zn-dependent protease with chaperone function